MPALVVNAQAPNITAQPVPQTVQVGDAATFSVTATGAAPLYYQWKLGATLLTGATTNPLVLPSVSSADAGNYSVVVSNNAGTAPSDKAALTVVARGVWGWGANEFGQATVPIWLSNGVAAAGGSVSVAVTRDGTATCWGLDGFYGFTNVPPGLAGVIAVAAGSHHSLALRTNGTVAGWGNSDDGEANGVGTWTNVVAVAAGAKYSMCAKADGTVAVVGDATFGGLPPLPPSLSNVTAIAAQQGFCLTVRGDGMVSGWGTPAPVPVGLNDAVAVACGHGHTMALRANGTVIAWGDNSAGQTNVPAGLSNVVSIAAGNNHCLALQADGTLAAWGWNPYGQTTVPTYVGVVGGIGGGCVADQSLAVPAQGPPFITSRLANQTWNPFALPASVYFRVQATGALPLRYQWQRNGVDLPGETNTVLKVSDLGNHQGRYSIIVSNALGVATIPSARLRVAFPQGSMQVALDDYLEWNGGGNSAWFTQSLHTVDGVDAARSGGITNNQQSWLETTVNGPGFLVYWWKVSSEADYDFLEFHLDGALQTGRISGDIPWQQRIVPITNGTHTLRWRYAKDAADTAGLDAGFLDYVSFSTTLPAAAKLPNGWFQLSFTNITGTPFTVVSSTNVALPLSSWTVLGSPTEIMPGQFLFTDPQATNNMQRFYRIRSP